MNFTETHILSNSEKRYYEGLGLYCYDFKDIDFNKGIVYIEKNSLYNRIGSIITDKKINVCESGGTIDSKEFESKNNCISIEELLSSKKNKDYER